MMLSHSLTEVKREMIFKRRYAKIYEIKCPTVSNHTLTITKAEETDAGTYKCLVSNEYGEASATTVISVKGDDTSLFLFG